MKRKRLNAETKKARALLRFWLWQAKRIFPGFTCKGKRLIRACFKTRKVD